MQKAILFVLPMLIFSCADEFEYLPQDYHECLAANGSVFDGFCQKTSWDNAEPHHYRECVDSGCEAVVRTPDVNSCTIMYPENGEPCCDCVLINRPPPCGGEGGPFY